MVIQIQLTDDLNIQTDSNNMHFPPLIWKEASHRVSLKKSAICIKSEVLGSVCVCGGVIFGLFFPVLIQMIGFSDESVAACQLPHQCNEEKEEKTCANTLNTFNKNYNHFATAQQLSSKALKYLRWIGLKNREQLQSGFSVLCYREEYSLLQHDSLREG